MDIVIKPAEPHVFVILFVTNKTISVGNNLTVKLIIASAI